MHFEKCDECLFKLCFDFEIDKYLKNFEDKRLKCKKSFKLEKLKKSRLNIVGLLIMIFAKLKIFIVRNFSIIVIHISMIFVSSVPSKIRHANIKFS